MWIETRIGPGVRTVNVVGMRGEVVGSPSDVSPSAASLPSSLPPSAPEPVPAPLPALPAYVVHDGVRHVPIDVLPWDVVTFRTICGQDVTADERVLGEATACEWCGRAGDR